jgi:hypothetical protein
MGDFWQCTTKGFFRAQPAKCQVMAHSIINRHGLSAKIILDLYTAITQVRHTRYNWKIDFVQYVSDKTKLHC